MKTKITITELNDTPQVGQFWRHRSGDIFLIIQVDNKYTLANLGPSDLEDVGMSYTHIMHDNIEDVFSSMKQFFTLIPSLSIMID